MNLPILQPGIREAALQFWKHHDSRSPQVIADSDKAFVAECLLLALATLYAEMDKAGPQPDWLAYWRAHHT